MDVFEKLLDARCRLLTREPWYGFFAMRMVWRAYDFGEVEECRRTMGVRFGVGGVVECLFYPPFVERLSLMELYGVIQHEIEPGDLLAGGVGAFREVLLGLSRGELVGLCWGLVSFVRGRLGDGVVAGVCLD